MPSAGSPSRPSGSSPGGSVGSVLVYSWQPVRELTGTDGARHAGMSQRLLQVVRSSCRLQLQVYYISGQAELPAAADLSPSRRRGHIFVEGCRVTHFQGNTEAQVSVRLQHPTQPRPTPLELSSSPQHPATAVRALRGARGHAARGAASLRLPLLHWRVVPGRATRHP